MRSFTRSLIVAMLFIVLSPWPATADDQIKPRWPSLQMVVSAQCSDQFLGPQVIHLREELQSKQYTSILEDGIELKREISECLAQYNLPYFNLARAWVEDEVGQAQRYLNDGGADQSFADAGADLNVVDEYDDFPPVVQQAHDVIRGDVDAFVRLAARSDTERDTVLDQCANLVRGNEASNLDGIPQESDQKLDTNVRTAKCAARRGAIKEAITLLRNAIHAYGAPGEMNAPLADSYVSAYSELADYEKRVGDKKDAASHIEMAYVANSKLITPHDGIAAQFKRIAPREYSRVAEQQWQQATRGMSADQIEVYKQNGYPCNVSSSDNAGIGRIEIWHYGCGPDGDTGFMYFTFHNGRLVGKTVL